MKKQKTTYDEITRCKISDSRNAVISACSTGGYTLAQQLEATEKDGTITRVFLRGAFHVEDLEGLRNLRNAIDVTIHSVELAQGDEQSESGIDWD